MKSQILVVITNFIKITYFFFQQIYSNITSDAINKKKIVIFLTFDFFCVLIYHNMQKHYENPS
jgi:hypothetical protein